MKPFCVVHDFDTNPETFWRLYFDPDFNDAFYAAVNVSLEVLEDVRTDGCIRRTVRYRSNDPVPAFVRALLPDGLGYDEHVEFDRARGVLHQRVRPGVAEGRTNIEGTVELEQLAAGRLRRTYAGSISIRIPVIGRRLEQNTARSIEQTQDEASAVTREWLRRPESISTLEMQA